MNISKKISIYGFCGLGLLTGCYDRAYPPVVTNCINDVIHAKSFFKNGKTVEGDLIKGRDVFIGMGDKPNQQLIKVEVYQNNKLLYIVDKKSIEKIMMRDNKVVYFEKDSFNFSGCREPSLQDH